MNKKILFVDRDGTLIDEPNDNFKVDCIYKLKFKPYLIVSLIKLINYGYELVMVTNQDNLGKSDFTINQFSKPHNFMLEVLSSQGINFRSILICPHNIYENCYCRKPKTSLVRYWLQSSNFDKKNSYVIGDRKTDIELSENMGISGILYNSKNMSWKKISKKIMSQEREIKYHRITNETKVFIELGSDYSKKSYINTGIYFFNHMLDQIHVHSGISLRINVENDIYIDDHHTIEDIGITLGIALKKFFYKKIGISRYGYTLPMDESLSSCVIDLSGRPYLKFNAKFDSEFIGDLSSNMIEHFFYSLSYSMKSNIYLSVIGRNDHHRAESLFKVFGRTLKQVVKDDSNFIPSSKGYL